MTTDWHPADIIAALRKKELHWRRFHALQGWVLRRSPMRLPAPGLKVNI